MLSPLLPFWRELPVKTNIFCSFSFSMDGWPSGTAIIGRLSLLNLSTFSRVNLSFKLDCILQHFSMIHKVIFCLFPFTFLKFPLLITWVGKKRGALEGKVSDSPLLTFIQGIPCTRHGREHFACIIPFHPHRDLMKQVLILPAFYS